VAYVCALRPKEHVVDRTDLGRVLGDGRKRGEVTARRLHLDATRTQRRKVWTAGYQTDVGTTAMQGGSDVGADSPRPRYGDLDHMLPSAILQGVCSLQYIDSGTPGT